MEGRQTGHSPPFDKAQKAPLRDRRMNANSNWRPGAHLRLAKMGWCERAAPFGSGIPKGPDWPFGADGVHRGSGVSGPCESDAQTPV
jgi:hypothetical protein